jgi:hypothetical protein
MTKTKPDMKTGGKTEVLATFEKVRNFNRKQKERCFDNMPRILEE